MLTICSASILQLHSVQDSRVDLELGSQLSTSSICTTCSLGEAMRKNSFQLRMTLAFHQLLRCKPSSRVESLAGFSRTSAQVQLMSGTTIHLWTISCRAGTLSWLQQEPTLMAMSVHMMWARMELDTGCSCIMTSHLPWSTRHCLETMLDRTKLSLLSMGHLSLLALTWCWVTLLILVLAHQNLCIHFHPMSTRDLRSVQMSTTMTTGHTKLYHHWFLMKILTSQTSWL